MILIYMHHLGLWNVWVAFGHFICLGISHLIYMVLDMNILALHGLRGTCQIRKRELLRGSRKKKGCERKSLCLSKGLQEREKR